MDVHRRGNRAGVAAGACTIAGSASSATLPAAAATGIAATGEEDAADAAALAPAAASATTTAALAARPRSVARAGRRNEHAARAVGDDLRFTGFCCHEFCRHLHGRCRSGCGWRSCLRGIVIAEDV